MKYILFSFSLLLLSCNSEQPNKLLLSCDSEQLNNQFVEISLDTWILKNKEVKSLLSDYIRALKKYSNHKNSFIQMSYRVISDSTDSYTFSQKSDIYSLIHPVPHAIFKFKNHLICCKINGLDIFKINDDFLIEFMKRNYPDQYAYYLKVGDYPPPITREGPEWKLTFLDGYLISKEVYNSQ